MFWLILLIVVAVLCALVLFLVAPAAGRKELQVLADQIPNARFIVNDQYSCHF